ncbi:MAG: hypothetical protein ACRCTA_05750 [Bacilli bacterium]
MNQEIIICNLILVLTILTLHLGLFKISNFWKVYNVVYKSDIVVPGDVITCLLKKMNIRIIVMLILSTIVTLIIANNLYYSIWLIVFEICVSLFIPIILFRIDLSNYKKQKLI